jgi:hypothetical protein
LLQTRALIPITNTVTITKLLFLLPIAFTLCCPPDGSHLLFSA